MKTDILIVIPVGAENRITSKDICSITGLPYTSQVRAKVNEMRANAIPIGADGNGYFIAEKPEDLDHTIASFNSKIHNMIVAREGLKKAQRLMREAEKECLI